MIYNNLISIASPQSTPDSPVLKLAGQAEENKKSLIHNGN